MDFEFPKLSGRCSSWLCTIPSMDYIEGNSWLRPRSPATPWTRWLTNGKTQEGKSQWKVAWENRDIHQLEREFYIIQ